MIMLGVFLALALSVFPINSLPTLPESECTSKDLSKCVFQTDLGTINEPDDDRVLAAFIRLNKRRLPAELRKLNPKDKLLKAIPHSKNAKQIEPIFTGSAGDYAGFVVVYFNGGTAPPPSNSRFREYTCDENDWEWDGTFPLILNEVPTLKTQITLNPTKIDKKSIIQAFWEANKKYLPCPLKDILDIGKIDDKNKLVSVFLPKSSKYGGSVKVIYSLSRT